MRKPRYLLQGASYHVSARLNNKEYYFSQSQIKDLFLMVIKEAKSKYSFSVNNFCIMNNHFHLIICPKDNENLSKIMQWIMSVFARRFNKITNRSGHVWGERFYSKIMYTLSEYLRLFLYIDNNPVKAGLVQHAFEWEYGGYFHFSQARFDIIDATCAIWENNLRNKQLLLN